jgi:predicted Fe-S protein YdhL (DUF1289 family)
MITPCQRICVLDDASGLCRGCGRTRAEVGRWSSYSDAERLAIMAELPQRLDALRAGRFEATSKV